MTVAVIFTGGTISVLPDPASGAAVPALDGRAILERTRGLDEIAQVEVIDWGLMPASHFSFGQLLDIARTVQDALDRPEVDGAVVVQGTDNIEETAFGWDLLLRGPKPVAVVGAMRNAAVDGYDGPANLRAAVRVAASPLLREQGVLVVMDGRILPADDATKLHTHAYGTFAALNAGPLGVVDETGITLSGRRARRRQLKGVPEAAVEPIFLVTVTLGMDGRLVELARAAGARGFVIAATGAGNTPPSLLEAAGDALEAGLPVVLTTRCPSGRATPTYGFPGGGRTWADAGAIMCGYLGGPKARVALALGLGAGLDRAGLMRLLGD